MAGTFFGPGGPACGSARTDWHNQEPSEDGVIVQLPPTPQWRAHDRRFSRRAGSDEVRLVGARTGSKYGHDR